MICKECGANMYLDDKDYNFKGNYELECLQGEFL